MPMLVPFLYNRPPPPSRSGAHLRGRRGGGLRLQKGVGELRAQRVHGGEAAPGGGLLNLLLRLWRLHVARVLEGVGSLSRSVPAARWSSRRSRFERGKKSRPLFVQYRFQSDNCRLLHR